jgi:hypothetical protein
MVELRCASAKHKIKTKGEGIMPLVSKNEEFRDLHHYYTTRAGNPLKKKQSLILLCCKLIRIFWAMLKKQVGL